MEVQFYLMEHQFHFSAPERPISMLVGTGIRDIDLIINA